MPLIRSIQTDTRCQTNHCIHLLSGIYPGFGGSQGATPTFQYCSNLGVYRGECKESNNRRAIQIANTLLKGHTGPLRKSHFHLFHLVRLFRLRIFIRSNTRQMETIQKRTSGDDQRIALRSMTRLKEVISKLHAASPGVKIKIQEADESITIPKKALSLLMTILSNMSEGKSITIIPTDSEVSTQQGADMLNVSRPHLIKLLENNTIPFKKVGSHRRILLRDLVTYEKSLQRTREEKLKLLSTQAQELNLGYE